MTNINKGHFYVGELPDGRYVAASAASPYFCFRGASEEEVLAKVKRGFAFFGETQGLGKGNIHIKAVTQSVTTLRAPRKVSIQELMAA